MGNAASRILQAYLGKRKTKAGNVTECDCLCLAVLTKNKQLVERVIRKGVDLDDRNCHNGITAVHLAVDNDLAEIIDLLIVKGANINIPAIKSPFFTPLISAIKGDNIEIVKQLLFADADSDKSDEYGNTPLHYAARHSFRSIELLYKVGADFNIPDSNLITPLIYAIETDQTEIVNQLLNGGAKPLIADRHGETALHYAARYSARSIELLVSKGANVDVLGKCHDFRYRRSPLMVAVVAGNVSTLCTLLNNGADVNFRSGDLRTSLHFAQSAVVVEILVESGADINTWDMDGNTPLHSATKQENLEVIEALLSYAPPPPDYGLVIHHCLGERGFCEIIIKFKQVYYDHITFASLNPLYFYDCEDFIGQCSLEVKRTKEVRFGQLSLFKLLRKEITDCTFGVNTEICEFIESEGLKHDFPLYHTILRRRLRIAQKRFSLIDVTIDKLTPLLKNKFQGIILPPEMFMALFSNLDIDDLTRLKNL